MSLIKEAKIIISGTRPLLIHSFNVECLSPEKKEKTGSPGNDPEEWKRSVLYRKEDMQLYLPGNYFFSCFCGGGKYIRQGRGSIQPKIASTLQIKEEKIFLNEFLPEDLNLSTDSEKSIYLDIRGVKNPNTKGKNVRYRVALKTGWRCEFTIMWDSSLVSVKEMESAIIQSGLFVGLADARSIGYGRFMIEEFKIL